MGSSRSSDDNGGGDADQRGHRLIAGVSETMSLIKKEGSFVAFSRQEELDTVCVVWAVSLSCRRQSLSKSRQTFRQSLFATFNLCQSVVPPSICLPQIAIPPIFFCRYNQHIKMTTKDCGIVELGIGPRAMLLVERAS